MKRIISFCCMAAVLFVFSGCGPSQKKLQEYENKIAELERLGVPDTALTDARVSLYQAKEESKRGNTSAASQSFDKLKEQVEKAEALYQQKLSQMGPVVDSLKLVISRTAESFTGRQKFRVDSMIAIVDSLAGLQWYLPAKTQAEEIVEALPTIELDQQTAEEVEKKTPGTWAASIVTKHPSDKSVHAIENKTFTFYRDGKAKFEERKKGKSAPNLEEDWSFTSWGSWEVGGDTIFMDVERFKVNRQNFKELHTDEEGKTSWKSNNLPTYDSTITDGSQDRWVVYSEMVEDFKKIK